MTALHGLEGSARRRLGVLYRRSGIEHRYSCLERDFRDEMEDALFVPCHRSEPPGTAARMRVYAREAPALAERAARNLLSRPGSPPPPTIDHLLVVSCTGFSAPGVDVQLARSLGLRADVGRAVIGFHGCQGGLSALRLADLICRARPRSRVLIVCVELCTLHFQHEPTEENLLANALFADGAAAVLVTGRPEGEGPCLQVVAAASALHTGAGEEMRWEIGDHGFHLHLSALLPRVLGYGMRDLVVGALGLDPAEIHARASWAVHPGGVAILDAIAAAFELPPDALRVSRQVLRAYGNMSSATIYFVLARLMEELEPGFEDGFALAFGPGLSVEAARLRRR
jgi:predicted naringenin-chalcone synthase